MPGSVARLALLTWFTWLGQSGGWDFLGLVSRRGADGLRDDLNGGGARWRWGRQRCRYQRRKERLR